jgi:hypothetical protein
VNEERVKRDNVDGVEMSDRSLFEGRAGVKQPWVSCKRDDRRLKIRRLVAE